MIAKIALAVALAMAPAAAAFAFTNFADDAVVASGAYVHPDPIGMRVYVREPGGVSEKVCGIAVGTVPGGPFVDHGAAACPDFPALMGWDDGVVYGGASLSDSGLPSGSDVCVSVLTRVAGSPLRLATTCKKVP